MSHVSKTLNWFEKDILYTQVVKLKVLGHTEMDFGYDSTYFKLRAFSDVFIMLNAALNITPLIFKVSPLCSFKVGKLISGYLTLSDSITIYILYCCLLQLWAYITAMLHCLTIDIYFLFHDWTIISKGNISCLL